MHAANAGNKAPAPRGNASVLRTNATAPRCVCVSYSWNVWSCCYTLHPNSSDVPMWRLQEQGYLTKHSMINSQFMIYIHQDKSFCDVCKKRFEVDYGVHCKCDSVCSRGRCSDCFESDSVMWTAGNDPKWKCSTCKVLSIDIVHQS